MLDLVYSSQTENLLDALIADLEVHRRERGPLEPLRIVVPNRNVEAFLRFGIARRTGIAANLEVHLLRRFVGKLLCHGPEPIELLDAEALRALVLEQLLDDAALSDDTLSPVRTYLHAAGDAPTAIDVRRVQLAEQLGRLFEEYGFSRAQMLRDWPNDLLLGGTPQAQTEKWQRALWLRICGKGGSLEARNRRDGIRRMHLGALLDSLKPETLVAPPHLHVFGVSYVAQAFQRIFALLAARSELRVYTLNPCREFWEDVASNRRAPASIDAEENAALRLWGQPGRENIRLLNTLCDCSFRELFPEALPETLLGRLQMEILERRPPRLQKREVDASVRVFKAPGIRREAEAIAEEIWALLQEKPDLRFNEIAVVVGSREREAYFSQLSAALSACHEIPHNVVDLELAKSSRLVEAVRMLLALPTGRFSRPEVLGLLTHPAARARFPEVDVEPWLDWCERLEIVHGIDRKESEGSYLDRDVFNWDQGLRRLALGAFMAGERSGETRELAVGAERYAPEEHTRDRQASAAHLAMAVRALASDVRFAREATLTMPEWAALFSGWVEAHLDAADPQDERELESCLGALRGLAEVDLGERAVRFHVAHELAESALAGLGGGRGQHLADGVVVASSQPMRALPFKVIFVAGLGEGQFPAADRRDPLDLRAAKPQPGDVSPRARDRYLFLETLLCAREKLYLSYVARDEVSGEALEPSSVVHELLQMLEESQLGPGGRGALVREIRMRRHEPAREAGHELDPSRITFPEVLRERAVVALREDLLRGASRLPTLEELRGAMPAATFARLAARLSRVDAPASSAAGGERIRLSLHALRKFLECPLQGYARFRLGMEDLHDDEDLREREDERFETSRFAASAFLKEVFVAGLGQAKARAKVDLEALHGEKFERLARAGRMPAGLFGAVERRKQLALLEGWRTQLLESPLKAARLQALRFGPAEEHEQVDVVYEPLRIPVSLAGGSVEVELVGRVGILAAGPWASLVLRDSAPKSAEGLHKAGLPAYVDQLALAAAGLNDQAHAAVVLTDAERATLKLGPVNAAEAKRVLGQLAAELLSGVHDYLMPCEAVFESRAAGTGLGHEVEALRENPHARFSSMYGPIRDLSPYAPPDESRANEIIEKRLGSYLSRLTVEEP